MIEIPDVAESYYIFDRASNNFKMVYKIQQIGVFFRYQNKEKSSIQHHQMEAMIT